MKKTYLKFDVPGKPMGKQRPRHTKNGHTYTPDETVNYENLVKMCFHEQYPDHIPTELPVYLSISAAFPIPQSWSNKKKEMARKDEIYPGKPDWDNIGKIISDALNGVAYVDDSLVHICMVSKYYSPIPGVSVSILYEEAEGNE